MVQHKNQGMESGEDFVFIDESMYLKMSLKKKSMNWSDEGEAGCAERIADQISSC